MIGSRPHSNGNSNEVSPLSSSMGGSVSGGGGMASMILSSTSNKRNGQSVAPVHFTFDPSHHNNNSINLDNTSNTANVNNTNINTPSGVAPMGTASSPLHTGSAHSFDVRLFCDPTLPCLCSSAIGVSPFLSPSVTGMI
jgi:hypothetical protein